MTEPAPLIGVTAADLIALEVLIGVSACYLWLLPAGAGSIYSAQARRLNRVALTCVAVLTATSIALLAITAQEMTGLGYAALPAIVPKVLTATHFGHAWIARAVCVLALWLVVSAGRQAAGPVRTIALLVFAFVLAATRSASGHAADAGPLNYHEISDWLHVVVTAGWAGAVIAAAAAVFPVGRNAFAQAGDCLARQSRRLSQLATAVLALVFATGIYNAWESFANVGELLSTGYGRRLVIKLVLVAAMLALGATNRFRNLPGVDQPAAATRFARVLYVEAGVAAAVLIAAALLINTSPPH